MVTIGGIRMATMFIMLKLGPPYSDPTNTQSSFSLSTLPLLLSVLPVVLTASKKLNKNLVNYCIMSRKGINEVRK